MRVINLFLTMVAIVLARKSIMMFKILKINSLINRNKIQYKWGDVKIQRLFY